MLREIVKSINEEIEIKRELEWDTLPFKGNDGEN